MISAHIGQQTSFASHKPLLSAAITRDLSSENDMTDEESTIVSSDQIKSINLEHSTPPSVDSSGSRINPLSRHKSRTSCDGDIDDTDSEISPAGSFFNEPCNPSSMSSASEATNSAMSITIPRPSEGESSLDGLFLICEALERPARRSGSTGTDRSSEISSPANSPLSGSPKQQSSLMSLRSNQPTSLSLNSSASYTSTRGSNVGCNYSLFENTPATPLSDTYQQYSHHHIHHNHDVHHQEDIILQPSNNKCFVGKQSPFSLYMAENGNNTNTCDKKSRTNVSNRNINGANVSHFPLSTLFTAAEALLPSTAYKRGNMTSQASISTANNMKPTKRTYTKRADKLGNKTAANANDMGASAVTVGKKSNAGRKPKNSEKSLTEKDIESKKRKREADKSLSSKKRYDASEKLAVVVEKLRKYFAMELHKL